jgi:hypothetical protein
MEFAAEKIEAADRQRGSGTVPAAEVRKTLSAIFQSTPFHSSKQSQELLQYIVDQSLADRMEMLKERVIGASVFDRRPDYDTNVDPIVRARAAEVRKRLAVYYQTAPEGAVRISIPSGSFRAIFEWADRSPVHSQPAPQPGPEENHIHAEPVTPFAPTEIAPPESPSPTRRFLGHGSWVVIAVAVVLLALATQHYFASADERAFSQFWSPILDHSNPILLYIGSNAVYELSTSYLDAYYEQHPRSQFEAMGLESYIPLPPGTKLDIQDLHPAKDTYVTIGDVAATTKIVAMLVQRGKRCSVRRPSRKPHNPDWRA